MTGRVEWRSLSARRVDSLQNRHAFSGGYEQRQVNRNATNYVSQKLAAVLHWRGSPRNATLVVHDGSQPRLYQRLSKHSHVSWTPLLPFFCCLWFKNKHDLGVCCSCVDAGWFFCFVLPPAAWKKPTRRRALKRTDIARQTRLACRGPPKRTR